MAAPGPVLLRCDAGGETGLGHLTRCLALAEALADEGAPAQLAGDLSPAAQALAGAAGVPHRPLSGWKAAETAACARELDARCVVVDSYRLDAAFLRELHPAVRRLVAIDDFAALDHYRCDAVLNFTVAAPELRYRGEVGQAWLGPRHFLARRRLRALRSSGRGPVADVTRVLLSFGGADTGQVAGQALDALHAAAPGCTVKLVAGPRTSDEIAPRVTRFAGGELLRGLPDLAEPLAWADLCVAGGGMTKYEAAFVGVPTAVLSQTVEQAEETRRFAAAGLAIDLGTAGERATSAVAALLAPFIADSDGRRAMHQAGRTLFGPPTDDPTRDVARKLIALTKESR
jgi:UDP-2,4-diacetamido-2,4,6-trideoxy-beta-L-altropyranose hydrolase